MYHDQRLMMSLNISESAKVVAILKQKTVSRIRVAKHRGAIAHLRFLMDFLGLQPNTIRHRNTRNSNAENCRGTTESATDIKLKFLLRKCKRNRRNRACTCKYITQTASYLIPPST